MSNRDRDGKSWRAFYVAEVLLVVCLASMTAATCKCRRAGAKETTIWGGNVHVVVVNEKPHRNIHGVVKLGADEEPIEKALVEVLTHPEHLLDQSFVPEDQSAQKRVRACFTGPDGTFCFDHLPAGKYELRISLGKGVDVTSEYVAIDPGQGQEEAIEVRLTFGT